jgi:hypothetical protein
MLSDYFRWNIMNFWTGPRFLYWGNECHDRAKNKKPSKKFILSLHQYIIFFSRTIFYYIILLKNYINNAQQNRVFCGNAKEVMRRNKQKVWTMTNSLLSDETQWIRGMQSCHSDVFFYCEHSSGYCRWWVLLSSVKYCCKWVLSGWQLWNNRSSVRTASLMSNVHFMKYVLY